MSNIFPTFFCCHSAVTFSAFRAWLTNGPSRSLQKIKNVKIWREENKQQTYITGIVLTGKPSSPWGPGSPMSPSRPNSPVIPGSPRSPAGPGGPGGELAELHLQSPWSPKSTQE